jgi:hypothetical protein
MEHGITVALAVSFVWIFVQNLLMHVRPAENRFKAMVVGYVLSLPFVYAGYRWLPPLTCGIAQAMQEQAPWMGLFHAYFFHLLLFLFYVECFYHVERSVTLRLLVELFKGGAEGASIQAIQGHYSLKEMIQQRMEVMRDGEFIEDWQSSWHLRTKGAVLARISVICCWLFQIKGQHERHDAPGK